MDERVHRYLDGELSVSELTEAEAAEARRLEALVAELKRERAGMETADLVSAVMGRIAEGGKATSDERFAAPTDAESPGTERRSGPRRFADWLLGPKEISFALRPVYAIAAAILLLVAGLQVDYASIFTEAPAVADGADPTVFVRFELSAPEAEDVRLAGSFSGWSPEIALDPIGNGRWMALVPLRPGVHDYAFRVDGSRWVTDPSAPRVADGFGGFNSRLSLVVANS